MANRAMVWKFQTADSNPVMAVVDGAATDARGLRLRAESGYGWVDMGNGWLQISVAIRKLTLKAKLAKLTIQQAFASC